MERALGVAQLAGVVLPALAAPSSSSGHRDCESFSTAVIAVIGEGHLDAAEEMLAAPPGDCPVAPLEREIGEWQQEAVTGFLDAEGRYQAAVPAGRLHEERDDLIARFEAVLRIDRKVAAASRIAEINAATTTTTTSVPIPPREQALRLDAPGMDALRCAFNFGELDADTQRAELDEARSLLWRSPHARRESPTL